MIQKNKVQKKNNKKRNVMGVVGKTLLTSALASGLVTADALAAAVAGLGVSAVMSNDATLDLQTGDLTNSLYAWGGAAGNVSFAAALAGMSAEQKVSPLTIVQSNGAANTFTLSASAAKVATFDFSAFSLYNAQANVGHTLGFIIDSGANLNQVELGVISSSTAPTSIALKNNAGTTTPAILTGLTGLPSNFVLNNQAAVAAVLTGKVPVDDGGANANKFYTAGDSTTNIAVARNTFTGIGTITLAAENNAIGSVLAVDIEKANPAQNDGWSLGVYADRVANAGNINNVVLDATTANYSSVIVKNVRGKGAFNITTWGATNSVGVLNLAPAGDAFTLKISAQADGAATPSVAKVGTYANLAGLGQAGAGVMNVSAGQIKGDVWVTNGTLNLEFPKAAISDANSANALITEGKLFVNGGELKLTTRTASRMLIADATLATQGLANATAVASNAADPVAYIASNATLELRAAHADGVLVNKISILPGAKFKVAKEANVAAATTPMFKPFAIVDAYPAGNNTPITKDSTTRGVFYGGGMTSVQSVTLENGTVLGGLSLGSVLFGNAAAAAAGNLGPVVNITKGYAIFNSVNSAEAARITLNGAAFQDAVVSVPNARATAGVGGADYSAVVAVSDNKFGTLVVHAASTVNGVNAFTFSASNAANALKSLTIAVVDDPFGYINNLQIAAVSEFAQAVTADMTVGDIVLGGYKASRIDLASAANKTLTAGKLSADEITFDGYGKDVSQFVVSGDYSTKRSTFFGNTSVAFNGATSFGVIDLDVAKQVFISSSNSFASLASDCSKDDVVATIATANSVSVAGAIPGIRLAFTTPDKEITAATANALLSDSSGAPIRVGGVAATVSASQITEDNANAPMLKLDVALSHAGSVVRAKSATKKIDIKAGIFEATSDVNELTMSGGVAKVGGTTAVLNASGGEVVANAVSLAAVSGTAKVTVPTINKLLIESGEVLVTSKLASVEVLESVKDAQQSISFVGAGAKQLGAVTFRKAGAYSAVLSTATDGTATPDSLTVTGAVGSIASDGTTTGLAQLNVGVTPIIFSDVAVIDKVVVQTAKVGGITLTGTTVQDGEISPVTYVVNSLTRASASAASVLPVKIQNGAVLIKTTAAAPTEAKKSENLAAFAISLNAGGGLQIASDLTASVFVSAEQEAAKTFVLARTVDKAQGTIVLKGAIGTKNSRVGALVVDNCNFGVDDVYATDVELRGVGRLKVANLSTSQVRATNVASGVETLAGIQFVNTTPLVVDAIIGSEASKIGLVLSGKDLTFSNKNVFLQGVQYSPIADVKDPAVLTFTSADVGGVTFVSEATSPFWVVLGKSQNITAENAIVSGGFKLSDGVTVALKANSAVDLISVNDGKASVIVEASCHSLGASGASLALVEVKKDAVIRDLYAGQVTVNTKVLGIGGNVKVASGISVIQDSAIVFSGENIQADLKTAVVSTAAEKTNPAVSVEFDSKVVNFAGNFGVSAAPLAKFTVSKENTAFVAAGSVYAQELSMPRVVLSNNLTLAGGLVSGLQEITLGTHQLRFADGAVYMPTGVVVLKLDVETKNQFGNINVDGAKTKVDFSKVEKLEVQVKPSQALSSASATSLKVFNATNGGSIVNVANDKISVTSSNDKITFKMLGNTLVMNSGSGGGAPEDVETNTKNLEDIGLTHAGAEVIAQGVAQLGQAADMNPTSQAAQVFKAVGAIANQETRTQAAALAVQTAAGVTSATSFQANNVISTGIGMNNFTPDSSSGAISVTDSGLGQAAGDCDEMRSSNVWLKPLYNFADQKKLRQTEGYKSRQFGFMLGGKHTINESGTTLGMTVGYLGSKNKLKGMMSGSYTDSRDVLVALYASQKIYNGFSLGALLAYGGGQNKSSSVRIVGANSKGAPIKKNAIGNYSVNNTLFQLRAEYASLFNDMHLVNPYITFGVLSVGGFEYKENGADIMNQTVKSGSSTVFQCTLGTNYSANIKLDEEGVLKPGAYLNFVLSGKNKATTTIQFTGADPIVTPTANNQTFMYNLGATLDMQRNGFEVGIGAGFVGAKSYTGATAVLNVKLHI